MGNHGKWGSSNRDSCRIEKVTYEIKDKKLQIKLVTTSAYSRKMRLSLNYSTWTVGSEPGTKQFGEKEFMMLLWSKDIHWKNSGNTKYPKSVLDQLLTHTDRRIQNGQNGQNVIRHIVWSLRAFGVYRLIPYGNEEHDPVTMRKIVGSQKTGGYGERQIEYDEVCDAWRIEHKNNRWVPFSDDYTNVFKIKKFKFRFDKKRGENYTNAEEKSVWAPVIEICCDGNGGRVSNRIIRLCKKPKKDSTDKKKGEYLAKTSPTMMLVKRLFADERIAHCFGNYQKKHLTKLEAKYSDLLFHLFGIQKTKMEIDIRKTSMAKKGPWAKPVTLEL